MYVYCIGFTCKCRIKQRGNLGLIFLGHIYVGVFLRHGCLRIGNYPYIDILKLLKHLKEGRIGYIVLIIHKDTHSLCYRLCLLDEEVFISLDGRP